MSVSIFKKALDTWGKDAQVAKLSEEVGELLQAVNKHNTKGRWRQRLIDEVGDVEIMLAQIKYIFKINKEVQKRKIEKMKRLKARLTKKEK